MRNLLLLLSLVLLSASGFSQASKNFTLAGHLTSPGDLNDVWGYADGNNREYALIGIQSGGVGIVDVTNPASPNLLQTIPGVPSLWRDLKVFGNYGYVVNDDGGAGGNGLLVIDLSTLPNTVAFKDTVIRGMQYAHNIYIDNGYLYVVGSNVNQGAEVYDLNADPWRPNYVGSYTTNYIHDIYVRNDTAWAGELNNGLTVIDFTNKANPQIIGNKQYIGNFTHNTWLSDDGKTCFTTDEVAQGWIYSWDVSDLNNIEYQDGIRSSLSQGQAIPHNTHVLNDYLVTSYYRDGIHLVDASRPNNIIEVGYYDTSTLSGDGFDGDWGAYPFLPSGIVLASDMQGGLFIFQPNYVRGCYLEGLVTDSVTTNPLSGVDITIASTSISDQSRSNGEYATGVADAGNYNVTFSKFGYESKTISVTLANGQLVTQNVELAPLARVNYTFNIVEQGTGAPIPNAVVTFEEITTNTVLSYNADANGQVVDPNFIQGSYDAIAGKWGYRTNTTSFTASTSSTSHTIMLDKRYYDDFALDFGWSVSGNATTGHWERGEPVGTTQGPFQFQTDRDLGNDIGDQCYVTGNQGTNAGDDDVDDGITILTSPSMDLSQMVEPTVSYFRWFANGGGFGGAVNDTLIMQIDNGTTLVSVEKITGQLAATWLQSTFTISNYISPSNTTRVRFICGDYGDGHLVEGAVDRFEVYDANPLAADPQNQPGTNLVAYPNPVVENSRVVYDLGSNPVNARLEIRDMLGREVYSRSLQQQSGTFRVNLDGPAGIYIANLINNGESVRTFKMIK